MNVLSVLVKNTASTSQAFRNTAFQLIRYFVWNQLGNLLWSLRISKFFHGGEAAGMNI